MIQHVLAKQVWLALGCVLLAAPALYAQSAIGEVFSGDASVRGSVLLNGKGTRVLSGSQVSAGDGAAMLRLERGGDVRICPGTNLSLSADAGGKSLVLGMNTGAIEVHYSLLSAADSLLTPDFRMQLISPGTFHLAVSVAPSGDTCLRTLAGNDASVFVAEMMGADSYQLSPGKSVLFKGGRISGATEAPKNCGCPETKAELPATKAEAPAPAAALPGAAAPVEKAGEAHLEVDTSFVYRGKDAVQDYSVTVAHLSHSTDNRELALALLPRVRPPAEESKAPEKKPGILHRFSSFMARLFGK